jgi:1,4-alpha-glucan branching enzyme
VFNFTPVVREGYRIGLPRTGRYAVRLNSDDTRYGGSGVGLAEEVIAEDQPYSGRMASAVITLPPLAMLVLKWEDQS